MGLIDSDVLIVKLQKIPGSFDEKHETLIPLQEVKKLVVTMPTVENGSAPDTARILSIEELKEARICWVEDPDDGMQTRLFPAVVKGTGMRANGDKAIIFLAHKPWRCNTLDDEWWHDIKDYRKWWRPWSQKPTEEQMEAAKWE